MKSFKERQLEADYNSIYYASSPVRETHSERMLKETKRQINSDLGAFRETVHLILSGAFAVGVLCGIYYGIGLLLRGVL